MFLLTLLLPRFPLFLCVNETQCLFTPRSTFSDVSAARRVGSCPKGRKSLTSCLEVDCNKLEGKDGVLIK